MNKFKNNLINYNKNQIKNKQNQFKTFIKL